MALEVEGRVYTGSPSRERGPALGLRITIATVVAALCLAIIHVSALANGYYQIYYGRFGWELPEVAFLLHYLLFGSVAVGCLAWVISLRVGDELARTFDRLGTMSGGARTILVSVSAGVTFAGVTLARYGLLRDTAITDDENAYVFMARVFASGRLYLPSMPAEIRPFFDNQFIINDGKWYGIYFPGHPLVLALGALVGAERWIPSLVAVLTVVIGCLVAHRVFGGRVAAIAALLFPVTVYMVLPSATLLAHSTAALALLTFVYGVVRIGATPGAIRWWIVAAIALVWAGVTRPLGPAVFAVPWLLWLLVCLRKSGQPRAWAGGLVFSAIGLAGVALFCGYNFALTGDPFQTGYQRSIGLSGHSLLAGQLPAPWPLPSIYEMGHTVLRLNFWEFGWPLSLLFVPFFRRTGLGRLLFLSTCSVPLAYALIGMTNVYALGPTHYSEIAVFVAILSASGVEALVERARNWSAGERWSRFAMAVPIGSAFCMLLVFLPIHAASLREMSRISRAPYELVERQGLERAVVFVHSFPSLLVPPGAWVYFHRNPRPDLLDPVLFVRHLGADRNIQLMRFFPDREAYVMGMQNGKLVVTSLRP